jgi:SPP1 gp7 family putative phage head morphogenesis protein
MPYTRSQLNRILAPDLIPADRVPNLTARTCESLLKRRMFAHEDATVKALYLLYRGAFDDIRRASEDNAERLGLRKLDTGRAGALWRMQVSEYAGERIGVMAQQARQLAQGSIAAAYEASYYGRLWMLDMVTAPDVQILRMPPPRLTEALSDDVLRRLLGYGQFDDVFETEIADLVNTARRSLNTSMSSGLSMDDAMRKLRDAMGIPTDRRQGYRSNFNRLQTTTRTYIMDASNEGSVTAYRANADILNGYEWLTAKDERVCPQCAALNGTTYNLNDTYRPPAHPNCRCTVIPIIDYGDQHDVPPRDTFGEWSSKAGVGFVLGLLLGNTLKSDRV